MAHYFYKAIQAASTEPYVALIIGFSTLILKKKAGKNIKGTSKHLQMNML